MTERRVPPALWKAGLSLLAACGMLLGCAAEKRPMSTRPPTITHGNARPMWFSTIQYPAIRTDSVSPE